MTSYKLAKYNIKSSLKSIIIYYCIFIGALTGKKMMSQYSGVSSSTSGLEILSVVLLFVLGLNFFRENFYFTQANNILRRDYFKATAMAILAIGITMSILDVAINRMYNTFMENYMMYDIIYSKVSRSSTSEVWIQSNSIQTLFRTVTFLFAFYIAAFGVGLLTTMIYYKCNKTMKVLVSLIPIAVYGIVSRNDFELGEKIKDFIGDLLGIEIRNSYMAVITFICLFIITMCFVYMIVRRAVVKKA
ncbi:hypothetical protein LL033_02410 [Clostridium estertheticum]|uniref:hypothetical protein n=1 Tax=Clostridium estertheticum TaxID=238834 RepID=UPI001C0D7070|nr:hypothetical protein [Clostridium estertheticum]MBU3217026.1 hypothetical protein [Clostridium estertheticum]WAG56110.1 hypothetical protein LL033_02410 [Clostridium estertheticum]